MTDLNSISLIGRLTHNAEIAYLPNGTAKVTFTLAVNRSQKDGDKWVSVASFFDIQFFGKSTEGLSQYLKKGTQICVQGSLVQQRWEKDGKNHSKIVINALSVQLLGSKGENLSSAPQNSFTPKENVKEEPKKDIYQDEFPEDIPF